MSTIAPTLPVSHGGHKSGGPGGTAPFAERGTSSGVMMPATAAGEVTSLATRSPDGRVRVGVIGAGSIAQIIHLPFLRDLADRFQIAALCDIATDTLDFVGDLYSVSPEAR